jgi:hypothetical protein
MAENLFWQWLRDRPDRASGGGQAPFLVSDQYILDVWVVHRAGGGDLKGGVVVSQ